MQPLEHLLLLALAHYVRVAPYTKVEESFNIQAIHDLIYNDGTDDFDHLTFPGVVPRTFAGAWFVSFLCRILAAVRPISKQTMQTVARAIIGAVNFAALVAFKRAVVRLYGTKRGYQVGNWFMVLLLGQFHLLFYLSRPLPNMFAMPLVLTAFKWCLDSYYAESLRLLAFAGILFRSELCILCVTLAATLKYSRRLSIPQIVLAGASGALLGGIFSFLIDTRYWRTPVIPEITGFLFNVVEGKSSQWGTEPFLAYFTLHLPKLVGNPLLILLAAYAMLVTPRNLVVLARASVAYVLIYSFQPHKELRFIIYVAPVLTALAARGIDYLYYTQLRRSVVLKVGYAGVALASLAAIAASLAKLQISAENYPGGAAIEWVNANARANSTVHLDVLACMTGVTRFQYAQGFTYDKTETGLAELWPTFDYCVLAGLPEGDGFEPAEWKLLHTVQAYAGLDPRAAVRILKSDAKQLLAAPLHGWAATKQLYIEAWYQVVRLAPALEVYERRQTLPNTS